MKGRGQSHKTIERTWYLTEKMGTFLECGDRNGVIRRAQQFYQFMEVELSLWLAIAWRKWNYKDRWPMIISASWNLHFATCWCWSGIIPVAKSSPTSGTSPRQNFPLISQSVDNRSSFRWTFTLFSSSAIEIWGSILSVIAGVVNKPYEHVLLFKNRGKYRVSTM